MKRLILMLFALLSFSWAFAQNGAVISVGTPIHDYGTIEENGGPVSHDFIVSNTGKAPLVINRVTASCGCTTPDWTKAPIAPGKTGVIKVTYNPAGRPGPFNKTISIYSNGKQGAYILSIKGSVIPKSKGNSMPMSTSIGDLKMTTSSVLFNVINPGEVRGERITIKNGSNNTMNITLKNTADYITASIASANLAPNETTDITVLFDGDKISQRGRISNKLPITISESNGKKTSGVINVRANVPGMNRSTTMEDLKNGPKMELSTNLVNLGSAKGAKSRLSRDLSISNAGKSNLEIYSISIDDENFAVSGGQKEIKPGQAATFKVSVDPKVIKGYTEESIHIISNDPKGPVRIIRVYAK